MHSRSHDFEDSKSKVWGVMLKVELYYHHWIEWIKLYYYHHIKWIRSVQENLLTFVSVYVEGAKKKGCFLREKERGMSK